jgi:hypothetical protein
MPACSNPPNRAPHDVTDRLIDAVAWAKTCVLITAATAPGSPERTEELTKLKEAVVDPRRDVEEVLAAGQILPDVILIDLRVCELAIPKLEAGAILRQPTAEAPKT